MIRQQRSSLLIVRISLKGRRLVIPVPIWVLETTLQALSDFIAVGEGMLSWRGQQFLKQGTTAKQQGKWLQYLKAMPISRSIEQTGKILQDLRKHGRFRLVEVEDSDTKVYIDLF